MQTPPLPPLASKGKGGKEGVSDFWLSQYCLFDCFFIDCLIV